MDRLGKIHWQEVKWILRYLKGTSHVGLVYDKSINICEEIVSYVNSDYVEDLDKIRSLTGYVFTLCGSVISWKTTLQSIIVLSTTEAEYMATTKAVKRVI